MRNSPLGLVDEISQFRLAAPLLISLEEQGARLRGLALVWAIPVVSALARTMLVDLRRRRVRRLVSECMVVLEGYAQPSHPYQSRCVGRFCPSGTRLSSQLPL